MRNISRRSRGRADKRGATGAEGASDRQPSYRPQGARAAHAAEKKLNSGDKAFYAAKLATARFYADQVLVQASALRDTVTKGAAAVMAVPEDSMLAA